MAAREPAAATTQWIFGYGSLIYKVDFPFLEQAEASISGWERRFWQGSHDHRGTPGSPGRVVTLIPSPGTVCLGMAYRVEHPVLEQLDHREKNGYERHHCLINLRDRGTVEQGVVYIATADNPAYLGPAEPAALADHIASARGPSGSNADYLLQLAAALRELGDDDAHVMELAAMLQTAPVNS